MANKRIDELPLTPAIDVTDLFEKERDPGGGKFHEKVPLSMIVDWLREILGLPFAFDTTDDLRANTFHQDGVVYIRLGDAARGDGFSSAYYYDEADAQADNGNSIIIPNDITRPATGSYLQVNL